MLHIKSLQPQIAISVFANNPGDSDSMKASVKRKINRLQFQFFRNIQQNNYTCKVLLQIILPEFLIPKRHISNSFIPAEQESLCCTNPEEGYGHHSQPSRTVSCFTTTSHSKISIWGKLQGNLGSTDLVHF